MRTVVAFLFGLAFVAAPPATVAGEIQITEVKALAGTWQGWVTYPFGQKRTTMIVKEDGSYEASTTRGAQTIGKFYLQDGTLKYQSSMSTGAATVSEDKGKTYLTVIPKDTHFATGETVYERLK